MENDPLSIQHLINMFGVIHNLIGKHKHTKAMLSVTLSVLNFFSFFLSSLVINISLRHIFTDMW